MDIFWGIALIARQWRGAQTIVGHIIHLQTSLFCVRNLAKLERMSKPATAYFHGFFFQVPDFAPFGDGLSPVMCEPHRSSPHLSCF